MEPRLQKYLFQSLKDKASPNKKIVIATHSHHFLDQDDLGANYICERSSNNKINVKKAEDLQSIIFRLLGNTLSSVLLPENVIVLEGVSDTKFLSQCLRLLCKTNYALHNSGSDNNIRYAVGAITQFLRFNNQNLSVYKNNIYIIADRAKDTLIREWRGLLPNSSRQLKVLSKNGIEYFYPERILKEIFDTTVSKENIVHTYLASNPLGFNDKQLTKPQLAQKVSESLRSEDLDDETNELFVFLKSLP